MSHSRQRSTSILLTSLLLLAQLLLAWHLPSHIGINNHAVAADNQTDNSSLTDISGEPCALGINGPATPRPAARPTRFPTLLFCAGILPACARTLRGGFG